MLLNNYYALFKLLFLFLVYALTFYIFGTGHDILKGTFSFLGTDFSKLTLWLLFLTAITVGIPLSLSDLREKQVENSVDLTIFDKFLSIKETNLSIEELSERRFKNATQFLYAILGISLFAGIISTYFLDVGLSNAFAGSIIYITFVIIFSKLRDPLMLSFISLLLVFEKLYSFYLLGRPTGFGLIVLAALVTSAIVYFQTIPYIKTSKSKLTLRNWIRAIILVLTTFIIGFIVLNFDILKDI